ncbi:MAG: GxxExxY protein [Phenylobacterium sp.]
MPVVFDGLRLDAGYRLDLLGEDAIIVEVKAVETMSRLFEAQLLTYLKLSGLRLGLLINFNVPLFKDGVRRLAL